VGNATMESFFSGLKLERVSRRRYRTRADLFDYIERFCNPRWRHSKLGNVSPMGYELRFTS
jgi:putative transposase